jgi:hypothetical protein
MPLCELPSEMSASSDFSSKSPGPKDGYFGYFPKSLIIALSVHFFLVSLLSFPHLMVDGKFSDSAATKIAHATFNS